MGIAVSGADVGRGPGRRGPERYPVLGSGLAAAGGSIVAGAGRLERLSVGVQFVELRPGGEPGAGVSVMNPEHPTAAALFLIHIPSNRPAPGTPRARGRRRRGHLGVVATVTRSPRPRTGRARGDAGTGQHLADAGLGEAAQIATGRDPVGGPAIVPIQAGDLGVALGALVAG